MELSKTTTNYAAKRFQDVTITEVGDNLELWITLGEFECEPDLRYLVNEDGSFTFYSNLDIEQSVKEELPATIWNEKHLREVLNFLYCYA